MSGWAPGGGNLTLSATSIISLQASIGVMSGGELSFGPGLSVTVNQGYGFLLDPLNNTIKNVSWVTQTVGISANSTEYIYVDTLGHIVISPSSSNSYQYIYLGRSISGSLSGEIIDPSRIYVKHHANAIENMLRDTVGSVFGGGAIVSSNLTFHLRLDTTDGHYYFGSDLLTLPGASEFLFAKYYADGVGGWVRVNPSNPSEIPTDNYDNGLGALIPIPLTKWVSHGIYAVGTGATAKYFMVYGQAFYGDATAASAAPPLQIPQYFTDGIVSLCRVVVQQGATAVGVVVDKRPFLNRGGSTTGGGGTGLVDPMTLAGDMIIRNAANITARLLIGTQGQLLEVSGTGIPAWKDPTLIGNTLGWGYQDFVAGSGPNLTLTANENGSVFFNNTSVISNSATVVRVLDNETFAYTGTTKLFSSKVVVNSQTGTAVVLNGAANAVWGDIRVYYMYNYGSQLPDGYTLAPDFINSKEMAEINALFITEEEFATYVPFSLAGDLIYRNGVNTTVRLPIGNPGQLLTVVAGVPAWADPQAITLGTANGLVLIGQQLSLNLASATQPGALSAADWSTFKAKQAALTIGDLTGISGRTSVAGGTGAVIGAGAAVNVDTGLLPSPVIADVGKVLLATGPDTAVWTAINTTGKFVGTFTLGDWVLNGAYYEIYYPVSVHQLGIAVEAQLQEFVAGIYTPNAPSVVHINGGTGDITLRVPASLVSQLFAGKIVVISGSIGTKVINFTVLSWNFNAPYYEYAIPALVHGRGTSPLPQIQELSGGEYNPVATAIAHIDGANGNIVLRVDQSLVSQLFAGRVLIT